ncbi:MAG: PAS domain S-box protein [Thermodesulfobacteriota bacterium]
MTEKNKTACKSIRTIFLLAMSLLLILLALPQFLAGSRLLHTIIYELGTELLSERLTALIQPIDRRYATLRRIGLEDSVTHLDEIRQAALASLAATRYKESGSVFVIGQDRTIYLSTDFTDSTAADFLPFFSDLSSHGEGIIDYEAGGTHRLAAYHFYQPWQSYIGLAISRDELFAAYNKFISISMVVLAAAVAIAFLFILGMQRLIITPIMLLTRFAEEITGGEHPPPVQGPFILELATLKDDVTGMVDSLRRQMEKTSLQLDIIKQREAELDRALKALQESEERYRTIYNAPSDGIFILDASTSTILDVNQTMLHLYGISREEALQLTLNDLSAGQPPYSQQEADRKIREAIAHAPQLFTWHARKKDGTLFWIEVSLKLIELSGSQFIIAVVRDITDRKLAEQALAAEKEQLAVTLRSIGDGVITTDTLGRVVMLNMVAEKLTGWPQEEAAGRPLPEVFRIINARTGEPVDNPADKILASGNIIGLANHTVLIARNGSKRHIADSGAPIIDPDSRIIGVVLVFRDVTEKLHYEQEILKVKKLESVGVLAGGIAHDFNNILTAIMGNITLARRFIDPATKAFPLLDEAEKASLRAKGLTQQLLTFAKGGSPVRQISSIASIIQECASFALRGSNVSCTFDMADDLWLVNVDQDQMSQVVQNMIINARQAMPQGGTISITCRNRPLGVIAGNNAAHDGVSIIIRDTGIGIPEELLDKIFDPYFSSKAHGSGLGLAICHSIIRNHDGSIKVASTPGQGTSFEIVLPACREAVSEVKAEDHVVLPEKKGTILVMDDEEIVRTVVENILQHLGYQVLLAKNGEEAIGLYRQALQAGEAIDAIIMDLTIPGGMGGHEAAGKILQINPAARVVVSSGYANDPIMANYRNYGFCAAVTKPFQLQSLMRTLQQVLT